MRAVRTAIAANWRVFTAIYVGTLLLELAFGWAGLGIAFGLMFVLRRRLSAYSRSKRIGLHSVEAWYFDDGVRDLVGPVDADDDAERGV